MIQVERYCSQRMCDLVLGCHYTVNQLMQLYACKFGDQHLLHLSTLSHICVVFILSFHISFIFLLVRHIVALHCNLYVGFFCSKLQKHFIHIWLVYTILKCCYLSYKGMEELVSINEISTCLENKQKTNKMNNKTEPLFDWKRYSYNVCGWKSLGLCAIPYDTYQ